MLDTRLFISLVMSTSKALEMNPQDKMIREKMFCLMGNYKSYYSVYNRESAAMGAMAYWTRRVKWDDAELRTLIERESVKNLSNTSGRTLVSLSYGLSYNREISATISEYVIQNIAQFDQRSASSIANNLQSKEIMQALLMTHRNIGNEIDLLRLLQLASDPGEILHLEKLFNGVIPRLSNLQAFCNILDEFSRKDHFLNLTTIQNVENKILSPTTTLSFKDFHHILLAFNHKTNYGRISQTFWASLEQKILPTMHGWPVGILMSYLSRTGFHSEILFSRLTPIWRLESVQPEVFREGFCALSNTRFFSHELVQWSESRIKSLAFTTFDIIQILRSFTLHGLYPSTIFGPLLSRLVHSQWKKITPKDKCTLHHIAQSIEIDRPPEYIDYISLLKPFRSELSAAHKINRKFYSSTKQKLLGSILSSLQIPHLESQLVHDVYEVDFLLPESGVVVELLGWPYHISQSTGHIEKRTLMKLRHLKLLNWKVLILTTFQDIETRLPAALQTLRSLSPTCIHISDQGNIIH